MYHAVYGKWYFNSSLTTWDEKQTATIYANYDDYYNQKDESDADKYILTNNIKGYSISIKNGTQSGASMYLRTSLNISGTVSIKKMYIWKKYDGETLGWQDEAYRLIDFGKNITFVNDDIYNWLTKNAVQIEGVHTPVYRMKSNKWSLREAYKCVHLPDKTQEWVQISSAGE